METFMLERYPILNNNNELVVVVLIIIIIIIIGIKHVDYI